MEREEDCVRAQLGGYVLSEREARVHVFCCVVYGMVWRCGKVFVCVRVWGTTGGMVEWV